MEARTFRSASVSIRTVEARAAESGAAMGATGAKAEAASGAIDSIMIRLEKEGANLVCHGDQINISYVWI